MPTLNEQFDVSRPAAPEDIAAGQYVCIMHVMKEFMPYWCLFESNTFAEPEPIRMHWLPDDAGTPLRVIEVCVPFVLVEQVDGTHRSLDLRRCRLARVSERFGRRAFKRLHRRPAAKAEGVE